MMMFSNRQMWVIGILVTLLAVVCCGDESASVVFTNVSEEKIAIYWHPSDESRPRKQVADVEPGESVVEQTFVGHTFSYDVDGKMKKVTIESSLDTFVMGPTHFLVACSTSAGTFRAHIMPEWAPIGAARFLHLVKIGYYDGCALNRVVKKFLTQFGISADYKLRTEWRSKNILDDKPVEGLAFQPGFLSYAGSGPNSRSTEIFVVMPGTSPSQLGFFGKNPWETPFGYVEPQDVEDVVGKFFPGYGDMSPWGNGPDPQKIYRQDGYEYLKQKFPKLAVIDTCAIISADSWGMEEEEL